MVEVLESCEFAVALILIVSGFFITSPNGSILDALGNPLTTGLIWTETGRYKSFAEKYRETFLKNIPFGNTLGSTWNVWHSGFTQPVFSVCLDVVSVTIDSSLVISLRFSVSLVEIINCSRFCKRPFTGKVVSEVVIEASTLLRAVSVILNNLSPAR